MKENNPYASLKFREFKLFLSIRLLTTIAFAVQFLIIEWKVWDVTKEAIYLAFVPLFEIVAMIPFALFYSGRKVEEQEKRNSLMYCIISCMFIAGFIAWVLSDSFIKHYSKELFLFCIYASMFVWGIVRSFYTPSAFALYSLILPKKMYANGATWNSSVWQLGAVIGPALGGVLYALYGAHRSLLVVMGLFFLSFVVLLCIKPKEIIKSIEDGSSKLTKALAGLRYIIQNKIVFSALMLDMIAVLFGGAVALLPIFIDHIIDINSYYQMIIKGAQIIHYPLNYNDSEALMKQVKSMGLGILRSAPSIGAIISMISVAYFPLNRNTGKILLFSVLMFGFCIIGFGLSTLFWVSFIFLVFSGIFDGVSVVIRGTILQLLTPDDMKGRVSSANSIFVGSSNELGAFESGLTAQWLGAVKAVLLGGMITVGFVFSNYFTSKKLRDFEFKDVNVD